MKLSRRKLAKYAATQLVDGTSSARVMNELAAYLIQSRRTRELELIVRDIEAALADMGTVSAVVTSARSLEADAKKAISDYIKDNSGAKSVVLREQIDESVIGGVRIEYPGHQLDTTIKAKLDKLSVN